MDAATKHIVQSRANARCEYCQVHQVCYPEFTFHIEHIIAKQHGGISDLDNLALSCHLCNGKKGPNLAGLDPETRELTPLFHPRKDSWDAHFELAGDGILHGATPIGRTTIDVLGMNEAMRVEIRMVLLTLERWD